MGREESAGGGEWEAGEERGGARWDGGEGDGEAATVRGQPHTTGEN
jgi:hypothetical protein